MTTDPPLPPRTTARTSWPRRVVSGGQTGVDRAALDVALQLGIPCGGWCPRGRLAEDGALSALYPLVETPSPRYPQRTEWNVRDSDATLILTRGTPSGGTALTVSLAERYAKPLCVVDLATTSPHAREWLTRARPERLNVAGPRESQQPGIYREARRYLEYLLAPMDH